MISEGTVLKISCCGEIYRNVFKYEANYAAVQAAIRAVRSDADLCTATFQKSDGSSRILAESNFEEFVAAATTVQNGRRTLRLDVDVATSSSATGAFGRADETRAIGTQVVKEFIALLQASPDKGSLQKQQHSNGVSLKHDAPPQPSALSKANADHSACRSIDLKTVAARQARRRRVAADAALANQWEEDTRDIDELIRDLGLQQSAPIAAGVAERTKQRKRAARSTGSRHGQRNAPGRGSEDAAVRQTGKAVQDQLEEIEELEPGGAAMCEPSQVNFVSAEETNKADEQDESDPVPSTLWPPTPDSTPPISPRLEPLSQLYYWLAVPVWPLSQSESASSLQLR